MVEDREQASVLGINSPSNEFYDGDVMAWLAPCPEAMTKHKPQCGSEHRFVGLLKARLLIKCEDFLRRGQLPVGTRDEALDLHPVNGVWLDLFHAEL